MTSSSDDPDTAYSSRASIRQCHRKLFASRRLTRTFWSQRRNAGASAATKPAQHPLVSPAPNVNQHRWRTDCQQRSQGNMPPLQLCKLEADMCVDGAASARSARRFCSSARLSAAASCSFKSSASLSAFSALLIASSAFRCSDSIECIVDNDRCSAGTSIATDTSTA